MHSQIISNAGKKFNIEMAYTIYPRCSMECTSRMEWTYLECFYRWYLTRQNLDVFHYFSFFNFLLGKSLIILSKVKFYFFSYIPILYSNSRLKTAYNTYFPKISYFLYITREIQRKIRFFSLIQKNTNTSRVCRVVY